MGEPRPPAKAGVGYRECRTWTVVWGVAVGCCLAPLNAAAQGNVQGLETTQREVRPLLDYAEREECRFFRNGAWHSAADARKLLEHKLKSAHSDPASLSSSEQFIDKLASRSSMSGLVYQIRCGDSAPVESGAWLLRRLMELRARQLQ